MGRFHPFRQPGRQFLIIHMETEMCQHRALGFDAGDPFENPIEMGVGRMGFVAQTADDPELYPG